MFDEVMMLAVCFHWQRTASSEQQTVNCWRRSSMQS
jgi:hypothetical protein